MKIQVLSSLVICLLNSVLSSEQQSQIHGKLTDHQFKSLFRRERRDVFGYEFVNIESKTTHRSKRELRPVKFVVNNKTVELDLYPTEHDVMSSYTPLWHVKTQHEDKDIYKAATFKEKEIDGTFYEDSKNMATVLAYYKDRSVYYDGIFGVSDESKVVKAVPEEWRYLTSNAGNHVIFNVSLSGKSIALKPDKLDDSEEKLDKPLDTLFPKLLIVVDYSLYEILNKDVQEVSKYIATFWNVVNLRYSKLDNPKVKIVVTGVLIAEDPTALEYIYGSRNKTSNNQVIPNELLLRCGQYFRNKFYNRSKFENYDAVITMGKLQSGIVLGAAFIGEICDDTYNVGYVHDNGSYSGVHIATHELGHLLGLIHDGDHGCQNYPEDRDNVVMAPSTVRVKEYVWSDCSKMFFQKIAWYKKSSCMENPYRRRQH